MKEFKGGIIREKKRERLNNTMEEVIKGFERN